MIHDVWIRGKAGNVMMPKLTVRRLLVVFAIGAVPLWFGGRTIMAKRAMNLCEANYHTRRESEERKNIAVFEQAKAAGKADSIDPWTMRIVNVAYRRVAYHARLAEQYRVAASYPWKYVSQTVPSEPGESEIWPRGDDHQLVEFKLSAEDLTSLSLSSNSLSGSKKQKKQNSII